MEYYTYIIHQYVYFQNNKIQYMNIEKYMRTLKNIINIWSFLCESKLKLYILKLSR